MYLLHYLRIGNFPCICKADAPRIDIASLSAEKLETAKQEMLKINPNIDVLVVPTDTSSEDSVDRLKDNVKSKFGVPDVLVNFPAFWSSAESITKSKRKEWWADFVRYLYSGCLVWERTGFSTEFRESTSKEAT
jgi:NAD(P)-dependent dehydrogenase (short-subunit alcohol dehydrogenase family)